MPKASSSEALPPAAKVADPATKDGVKTAESTDKSAYKSQSDAKKQENLPTIASLKEFNKSLQQDKNVVPAPAKSQPIENQVATAFKDFARKERHVVREKAEDAKKKKLRELMSFANTFKLGTPVPNDLIGIIAKDPKKQLEIQEKAKKERRGSAAHQRAGDQEDGSCRQRRSSCHRQAVIVFYKDVRTDYRPFNCCHQRP